MKKTSFIRFLLTVTAAVLLFAIPYAVRADSLPMLGTSGKQIVNSSSNQEVKLRGVNAGGLFVTEDYMTNRPSPSHPSGAIQYEDDVDMMNQLESQYGDEKTQQITSKWQDNYWTEQDFENVKNMGMNVIRLPFAYYNLIDYANYDPSSTSEVTLRDGAFDKLDSFIDQAGQHGLYVILDLHGAFGSQSGQENSGDKTTDPKLFKDDSEGQRDRALTNSLWEKVAEHYQGNSTVAGYDLLNEPKNYQDGSGRTDSQVFDYYDQLINTIRGKDSDHIIFLESTWEPSDMPNPADKGWTDNNIVYQYHFYAWDPDNSSADAIRNFYNGKVDEISEANYNVPAYIGEFSIPQNSYAPTSDDWQNVLSTFNKNDYSWTIWNYKTTADMNTFGLYQEDRQNQDPNSDDWGQAQNLQPNTTIQQAVKNTIGQ